MFKMTLHRLESDQPIFGSFVSDEFLCFSRDRVGLAL